MSGFEYDSAKSTFNRDKHGIDFDDAQQPWQDEDLVEVFAKITDEPLSPIIGKISGKHWSAVITQRETDFRIISVTRSGKAEVALYES
ncbi:BrnT family toxin [Halioxenophilus aromaticivorans]|uniref:BrnT family toxin n=1 Tax=Halioxenophilus aromaticivorans TaxID=1306992 RepID=A0AAV3U1H5_9ALTE